MIIQLNLRDKKDKDLIKLAVEEGEKGQLQTTLRELLTIGLYIKQTYGDGWQSAINGSKRPAWADEILDKLDGMQLVTTNGKQKEEASGDLGGLFDFGE